MRYLKQDTCKIFFYCSSLKFNWLFNNVKIYNIQIIILKLLSDYFIDFSLGFSILYEMIKMRLFLPTYSRPWFYYLRNIQFNPCWLANPRSFADYSGINRFFLVLKGFLIFKVKTHIFPRVFFVQSFQNSWWNRNTGILYIISGFKIVYKFCIKLKFKMVSFGELTLFSCFLVSWREMG